MSGLDSHRNTLALIEGRLDEPLSLADIAGASGLSAFHFSRLFTALHGESVMAYVRRRRLARAARRLSDEEGVSLVELALESGFESQQAFTRAFTRLVSRFRSSPVWLRLRGELRNRRGH